MFLKKAMQSFQRALSYCHCSQKCRILCVGNIFL